MRKNKLSIEENDSLVQTVMENLHLNSKKAISFAKQARALQHNLSLRKKQMKEREQKQPQNSSENK